MARNEQHLCLPQLQIYSEQQNEGGGQVPPIIDHIISLVIGFEGKNNESLAFFQKEQLH